MPRVIVLSDIHLRHRQMDQILAKETYDRVIFTGDIFDSWGDTPTQNADAARWLKEKLANPCWTILSGNHDHGYIYPDNGNAYCSGFTRQKAAAIRAVLTQEEMDRLKLFHVESNILFTHAGLDNYWISWAAAQGHEFAPLNVESIGKWLEHESVIAKRNFASGSSHPFLEAGRDRGGRNQFGGLNWADFSGHHPIPMIGQIVGHSVMDADKGPLFRLISKDGSPTYRLAAKGVNPRHLAHGWTLCMDTHNKHYGILEDGILTIKHIKWDRPYGQDHYSCEPGEVLATITLKEPAIQ